MGKNKTNSWIIMAIAFVVSCLIWYMVTTHVAPDITLHLSGNPVNIVKEDPAHKGLAYYIEDYQDLTITVDVPQLKAALISNEDFRLIVNVSKCKEGINVLPVEVVISKNKAIIGNNYSLNHDTVTVRAERLVTKELKVSVEVNGTPGDGLIYGRPVLKDPHIQMRVPESLADQEYEAYGSIDVTDQKETLNNEVALSLRNSLGEVIDCDSQQIYLNQRTVSTTVPIGQSASIPIQLPNAAIYLDEGIIFHGVKAAFDKVDVIGAESVVSGLNNIVINVEDLKVKSHKKDYDINIALKDFLPDNTFILDKKQDKLKLKVSVEKIKNVTLEIPKTQVKVKGLTGDYKAEILSDPIRITVSGGSSTVSKLSPEDFQMTIDLSKYEEGEHSILPEVSLTSEIDGGYFKIDDYDLIDVMISGS